MRNWIFKLEVFASLLGVAAGVSTALFDSYVLSNDNVPIGQLNADIIYPVFFQLVMYAYLLNTRRFVTKSIFIGTVFFIVANLLAFGAVFATVPLQRVLVRFQQVFPGVEFSWGMVNISVQRLTTSFILMLLALALARLLKLGRRQS